MKNILLLFSGMIFVNSGGVAYDTSTKKNGYEYNNNFDLALATSRDMCLGALSRVKFHSIAKKKRFKIGYGLHFTPLGGNDLYYVTTPPILTSKQTGPQVLFSPIYYGNVDAFWFSWYYFFYF